MLQQVKTALKNGNLKSKIVCSFLCKLGYSNLSLQALEVRNKAFRYFNRKYSSDLKRLIEENKQYPLFEKNVDGGLDNIWIFWAQGFENAPKLVKKCAESVKSKMYDKKVHFIDSKNMQDYVEFPEYIMEKWRKGIISTTHLSDLLRLELLITYGGVWLDATVFLTDRIPDYMYSKDLFLYEHTFPDDITITCNNFFIIAKKGNTTLNILLKILYLFWEKETKIRDYFLWHLFMTMLLERSPDIWDGIYKIPDNLPEVLSNNILMKFDKEYWEIVKEISPIHKLSNKYNISDNVQGTYYDFILNN